MNNRHIYRNLLYALQSGEKTVTATVLDQPPETAPLSKHFFTEDDILQGRLATGWDFLLPELKTALLAGNPLLCKKPGSDARLLLEPFFPEPQLLILGGGHIAVPLAEFGARTGFSVTVVDDRPAYAHKNRFPHAKRVLCDSFSHCFQTMTVTPSSYVVIVTRGHRYDIDCLRQVLPCPAAYIGMIGSKRRVAATRDLLLREGFTKEELQKLNAPIGLDIGAETPEEIAVSIIAQVISCHRNGTHAADNAGKKVNYPESSQQIIEALSEDCHGNLAIITVLASKGSAPRKPGAKMLVWPDGRTLGSIGGGFLEAEAISAARDVIRSRFYQLKQISMTADITEEEGMVCGGIVEILIEPWL